MRSRSSGSYPCAMAAANRTRSRVSRSRPSCFAIIIPNLGDRRPIIFAQRAPEKGTTGR